MDPLIVVMQRAAERAARKIIRDFGELEQLQVSRKGPSDFVTRADRVSEFVIISELKKARPTFGFLAEESGVTEGEEEEWIFIIDPIDGTSNFMHGLPHVCISIAAARRDEKGEFEIEAGIIYDITRHECFWAAKTEGAWLDGKRLKVSGKVNEHEMLISTGLPSLKKKADGGSRDREIHGKSFTDVSKAFGTVRCLGSAALDLAYVAAGRADAFWHHNLQPWDVAAGIIMVKEAGGLVLSLSGRAFDLDEGSILAGQYSAISPLQNVLAKNRDLHNGSGD